MTSTQPAAAGGVASYQPNDNGPPAWADFLDDQTYGAEPLPDPPTLTAVAPSTAAVGAPATTITLTGTNFWSPADVVYAAPGPEIASVPMTVTSDTSGTAVLPASVFDAAGTVTVQVQTPSDTSAAQNITVS